MELDEYILRHIDAEGELLHALWRDTQLRLSYGQMASGHLQGRLLKMLVEMIKPLRVLELGTFSGYSALCMAEGLKPEAELHTIEIFDEMEDFIRSWIERSPHASQIHLHIGNALDIVPTLKGGWDLVFIDANKRDYIKYYNAFIDKVRSGGFIIADNVLWSGKVLSGNPTEMPHDPQTMGIHAFNQMISQDPRVENIIIPLRDGINLIRKK